MICVHLNKNFPFPDFKISLWKTVFHYSLQLGVQNRLTVSILEEVGLSIRVSIGVRSLPVLWGGNGCDTGWTLWFGGCADWDTCSLGLSGILPDQIQLLAVLCGYVKLLVGLCYYFWLDEVIGWLVGLAELWAWLYNHSWFDRISAYDSWPNGDSGWTPKFRQDYWQDFADYTLWSGRYSRKCLVKFYLYTVWASWSDRPLLRSAIGKGHWLGFEVGRIPSCIL